MSLYYLFIVFQIYLLASLAVGVTAYPVAVEQDYAAEPAEDHHQDHHKVVDYYVSSLQYN